MSKELKDDPDWRAYKEHVKNRGEDKAVWLKDAVNREVTIYCRRSPSVHGKVKALDLRFGRVMIENSEEIVEVSMGDISQVRYSK